MNIHKKTLITVLLVAGVIGVMAIQTSNTSLFRGQLKVEEGDGTGANNLGDQVLLPDLSIRLKALAPEGGDVSADITIENLGPGSANGETPFKYALYLEVEGSEPVEIFSNVDSYTFMDPGDSFNFVYPVSRQIYQYPEQFNLRFEVDVDDQIEEESEANNTAGVEVFL